MIGEILGSVFDRAVTLFFRTWPFMFVGWAYWFLVSLAQTSPGSKFFISELASIFWIPVPGLIAAGVPPEAMLRSGRTYWKVALAHFGVSALPLLAISMFGVAIPLLQPNVSLIAVIALLGFVLIMLGLFVAIRCSMAGPAILVDGRTVVDAFRRSLTVTKSNEGQTIRFLLAVGLAIAVILLAPTELVSAWLRSQNKSAILDWWGNYSRALLFPLAYYTSLASWLGSIRWYEYLESRYIARTDGA